MERKADCGNCSLFTAWFAGGEHVRCPLHGEPAHEFIIDRGFAQQCEDYDGDSE